MLTLWCAYLPWGKPNKTHGPIFAFQLAEAPSKGTTFGEKQDKTEKKKRNTQKSSDLLHPPFTTSSFLYWIVHPAVFPFRRSQREVAGVGIVPPPGPSTYPHLVPSLSAQYPSVSSLGYLSLFSMVLLCQVAFLLHACWAPECQKEQKRKDKPLKNSRNWKRNNSFWNNIGEFEAGRAWKEHATIQLERLKKKHIDD